MAGRRAVWLLWCAALGILYLFENNTATRMLLLGSLLLPLLDGLLVRAAVRRGRLTLEVPGQAAKDSDIPVELRIACPIPLAQFRVCLESENHLTGETARYTAWAARSGIQGAAHRCLLKARHCGLLTLRMTVSVSGFLGTYERSVKEEQSLCVWVPPALRPLRLALSGEGGAQEESTPGKALPHRGFADALSVREYLPGDPVRMIHWKLTEKLDTAMIREPERPLSGQVLLVVDLSGHLSPAGIDAMTETLFSLSHALMEAGMPHGVLWLPAAATQPELHRIESEADQAVLEAAYFAAPPQCEAVPLPDEAAQGYSQVVLIGQPSLAQAFEKPVTWITDAVGQQVSENCRIILLPTDATDEMIIML